MEDCSPPLQKIETLRQTQKLTYPVNVGRNAARQASKTNFVLVSDIELIPSKGLNEQFANLLQRLTERRNSLLKIRASNTWTGRGFVYVLPVFEVKHAKTLNCNITRSTDHTSGGTFCDGAPGKGAAAEAIHKGQGCVFPSMGLSALPEVPRSPKVAQAQRETGGYPGKNSARLGKT